LVAIAYDGISQTSSDSTILPNEKLRLAINKIEAGKVSVEQISLLNNKVSLLKSQLSNKDSLISDYKNTVLDLKNINERDKRIISEGDRVIGSQAKVIGLMQKKMRTQSWLKWVFFGAGLGAGLLIK